MSHHGKICPVSFGFGWGVISGLGWMLLAWAGARWGVGLQILTVMSNLYYGLAPTFFGGLWGLLWGFVDSFIFASLAIWVYNRCSTCCARSSCHSDDNGTCCK